MSALDSIIKKVVNKKIRIDNKKRKVNETDIFSVVQGCRDEIQLAEDSGIMPSPKYFEQAALLSQVERRYDNEKAICEMYIDLANEYIVRNDLNSDEVTEKILPVCAPLIKHLQNAKIMLARINTDPK